MADGDGLRPATNVHCLKNPWQVRIPTECLALASWFKRQDRRCDFPQIIIELMVAARQAMDASLRNRACVELDMRRWRDFILKPMIEMDGDAFRKARTKVMRELKIVG